MATLAPSSARARALAAPIPREPPVTSATLPVRVLVIEFLRCSNSDHIWICTTRWVRNRNYRNVLFLILLLWENPNGKASRFRRTRDFRKSRGITVICGGSHRVGAVQSDGLEGCHAPGRAARWPGVQP